MPTHNPFIPSAQQWAKARGLLHTHKWIPGDTVNSVLYNVVINSGIHPSRAHSAVEELRNLARQCYEKAQGKKNVETPV